MKVATRVTIYTLFAISFAFMALIFGFRAYRSGLDTDPVNAPICTAFICVAGLFWFLRVLAGEMKDPVKKEWDRD